MVLSQWAQLRACFPTRWQRRAGYIVLGQSFHFKCRRPCQTLHMHTLSSSHAVSAHTYWACALACSNHTCMHIDSGVQVHSLTITKRHLHSVTLVFNIRLQVTGFVSWKLDPTKREQKFWTMRGMHWKTVPSPNKAHKTQSSLSVGSITHSSSITWNSKNVILREQWNINPVKLLTICRLFFH